MVHAYHVIFGAYGFWLPNDPRGSWSDFVGAWELARFGRSTKSLDRRQLTPIQELQRKRTKKALKYPAVQFSGIQARAVGRGFHTGASKSGYTIWAASILPEHVHLVIARHRYRIEQIATLLKSEATKQLKQENLHPLAREADRDGQIPCPWARGAWSVFLDSEQAIENAIHYVEENPLREGRPRQHWPFVTAFRGLRYGWVAYY